MVQTSIVLQVYGHYLFVALDRAWFQSLACLALTAEKLNAASYYYQVIY